MSKSARFVRRGVQGVVRQNYFWPGVINAFSNVSITAGEVGVGGSAPTPPGAIGQNFFYKLGAASVWVSNVCPHKNDYAHQTGGVEFLIHVDWDSPLDVAITITVDDAYPIVVQGF